MSLEIKITSHREYCKISLIGDCNVYSATKLKQSLIELLDKNDHVLVDLEKVTEFDTAGLQVFISAKKTTKANNKKIKFISHPSSVIAVFDLYGLVSFFGDKIILTPEEKKKYSFRYGIKKLPFFVY